MNTAETITFRVADMTCGHCAATIRGALEKSVPDADVDIDVVAARVSVAGDADMAEAAIRAAGYTPERV